MGDTECRCHSSRTKRSCLPRNSLIKEPNEEKKANGRHSNMRSEKIEDMTDVILRMSFMQI